MTATLVVRAVAPDGSPVAARFYVTDASGEALFPASPHVPMRNDRHWASERHFVADGDTELRLPPGRVTVVVERGPEFERQESELTLNAGERRDVRFVAPRWIDMNARGWFSGDVHVHRRPDEMRQLMLAEDLNVGTCIATQWRDDPSSSTSMPAAADGWLSVVDSTHAYSAMDAEVERLGDGPGAVVAIGLRHRLAFECERWYPPDAAFADLARAAGGHVDAEKPVWDVVPVLAALAKLDSVSVVCNHFARTGTDLELAPWGARLPADRPLPSSEAFARWVSAVYHRLLNCGFRLPVTGGSASGIIPNPLGYNRTYVRLTGGFSYEAWLEALRLGRSFATNGPMLSLAADGRGPGEKVEMGPARTLHVRAEAESAEPLYRLELLLNGEVVAERGDAAGGPAAVLEHELKPSTSGWLAARAFAGAEPNVRFAHTSPIYLSAAPAPPERTRDASWLGEWVGETLARAGEATADWPAGRRDETLDPLRRALAVYGRLSAG